MTDDVEPWLDAIEPQDIRDGKYLRAIGQALASLEDAIERARKAGESESAIQVVLATGDWGQELPGSGRVYHTREEFLASFDD